MGAPIVVNTVKVQGTVTSNPAGTAAIIGTVSQNATWNVNATQSGNWNVGGTVNQGGSWTVTANVGSGTWPVTAIQSGNWFVGGTVTATNSSAGALFVQGTTTATIPAAEPAYISGTITSNVGSGTRLVNNTATSALYVQGTTVANVTGTVGISNQQLTVINNSATALYTRNTDANALYVQGTTTTNIPSISPAYVTGTVQVSNGTIAVSSVGGSVETYTNGTTTVSIVGNNITVSNNSATALYVQGTVSTSGTIPVSNVNSSALFIQGSVTALPGTGATSLGKAEDGAFTSGDVGVMSLAVRNDSGTALTNTNLDYSPISVDSTGKVQVIERGSTIGQGSVTIGTAMGTVLTTSSTRRTILIQNLGTDYVWLGGSTAIVVNTGARLAPGQSISIDKSPISAIYAVASSGSQVLSYLTESD